MTVIVLILICLFLVSLVLNYLVVMLITDRLEQRHPSVKRHVGHWTRFDRVLVFWSWGDGAKKLGDPKLTRLVAINRLVHLVALGAFAGAFRLLSMA